LASAAIAEALRRKGSVPDQAALQHYAAFAALPSAISVCKQTGERHAFGRAKLLQRGWPRRCRSRATRKESSCFQPTLKAQGCPMFEGRKKHHFHYCTYPQTFITPTRLSADMMAVIVYTTWLSSTFVALRGF